KQGLPVRQGQGYWLAKLPSPQPIQGQYLSKENREGLGRLYVSAALHLSHPRPARAHICVEISLDENSNCPILPQYNSGEVSLTRGEVGIRRVLVLALRG